MTRWIYIVLTFALVHLVSLALSGDHPTAWYATEDDGAWSS